MKRILIDLEKCDQCSECRVCASAIYHPQGAAVTSLREYATFATICRHCEEAPCVNSCYRNALERVADGHIKRYKMRCTSCKSCSVACPFGVILTDFIPYYDAPRGYHITGEVDLTRCAQTCPEGALTITENEEDVEKNIYVVSAFLAVHARKWSREDVSLKKK